MQASNYHTTTNAAASLQAAPSGNRLHIGVFGKTNSGKSSFINAFCGQQISIVSEEKGTTTDPVYKAMELHPIGPVTFIDTAGFSDGSNLEQARMEKTGLAAEKTDIAIFLISCEDFCHFKDKKDTLKDTENSGNTKGFANTVSDTLSRSGTPSDIFAAEFPGLYKFFSFFKEKKIPMLFLVNKADMAPQEAEAFARKIQETLQVTALPVSATKDSDFSNVKESLLRLVPEDFQSHSITGNLVNDEDLVLLVMPQDIQAPKGRLILPQVQTIRELLDKKCMVMSVTTDKLIPALKQLTTPPKLIITDSQVFPYVYENKPAESKLTSFSVLFAAYKGDISYYTESVKTLDTLKESSRVLIAECCTHAPLSEDIGREKIPRLLRKKIGAGLTIDVVSGTDFPEDLSPYDVIIQCGGCMFNRTYVLSRIARAKTQGVPMTNYGITIAHLSGILKDVELP